MEIQKLPDKMIDIKKIEFNQDRLYILGEKGDLWGMGSNSNFRLKSHMDEHLRTLE
jgi:alpha-tubulin suppressor-like RCC1 family protein